MNLRARFSSLLARDWRYPAKCAALIGFILALVGAELYHVLRQDEPAVQTVQCAEPTRGCGFELNGRPAHLQFVGTPSGLHPFTLKLDIPGAREVYASFTMRGMDMGYNRYRLLGAGKDAWQARVVLPVCVTGRRDWMLTLSVDDASVEIPFSG